MTRFILNHLKLINITEVAQHIYLKFILYEAVTQKFPLWKTFYDAHTFIGLKCEQESIFFSHMSNVHIIVLNES